MRKPKCQFMGFTKQFQNYGLTFEFNFPPEKQAPADKRIYGDCRSVRGSRVGGHMFATQINLYYTRMKKSELGCVAAHEIQHAAESIDGWLVKHGAYRKGADRTEARASLVQLMSWCFEQYILAGMKYPFSSDKLSTPVDLRQYVKWRASKMGKHETDNKCPYHKTYKGLRRPTADCPCCEGIFDRKKNNGGQS